MSATLRLLKFEPRAPRLSLTDEEREIVLKVRQLNSIPNAGYKSVGHWLTCLIEYLSIERGKERPPAARNIGKPVITIDRDNRPGA